MPQFVCRHPGCGTTFAADPGALDKFLDHITKRRKEEAVTNLPPHRRHPILPDTTSLELQPNPYYRPPNRHDDVPQRLGDVKAPPETLGWRNPEDSALKLRWTFRRRFEKRVEQALIGASEAAAEKRQWGDTPVLETRKSEKRAKSNSDQDWEKVEAAHGIGHIGPQVSPSRSKPKLEMTPAVRLERFEPLGKCYNVTKSSERQENTASPGPMAAPQGSVGEVGCRQPTASGTSAEVADRAGAAPPSKTKLRRSAPRGSTALSTTFESALHPRDRAVWDQLCGATDYETGQLKGDVGTAEDPLFMYEEAVRQRLTEQKLLLCIDIVPAEGLLRHGCPNYQRAGCLEDGMLWEDCGPLCGTFLLCRLSTYGRSHSGVD